MALTHLGPSLLPFTHIFRSCVSGQSWALSPWPELSKECLSPVNMQPCLCLLKDPADLVWDLQADFLAWPCTCLVTVGLPSNYRTWSRSVDWLWTCLIFSSLAMIWTLGWTWPQTRGPSSFVCLGPCWRLQPCLKTSPCSAPRPSGNRQPVLFPVMRNLA